MNKQRTKKSKLVARLTESDIMKNLRYTDLIGVLQRLGEKSIGGELYKVGIYTDIIYGSKYTIKTFKRLVADPRSYNFVFPAKLGKIYVIKYFKKMFGFTEDDNYLNAIKSYQNNSDPSVSDFAKQTVQEIQS